MSQGVSLALVVPHSAQSGEFLRRLLTAGILPGLRPVLSYEANGTLGPVEVFLLPRGTDLDAAFVAQTRSCGSDILTLPEPLAAHGTGLVVTDVDSTLIGQEVIEEIAHYAGTRDKVARITERAMNGELDFAASLRERVATLAGVPEQVFSDVSRVITVTTGARELIDAVHANGGVFGIVSGGFEEVVAPLAASLGIDHYCANRLEVKDGVLTGRVLGTIVTADTKVKMLHTWATEHNVPLDRTVAIGDGANDIPMMHAAGMGVAFCAKPAVCEQIDNHLTIPRLDVMSVVARPLAYGLPTLRA